MKDKKKQEEKSKLESELRDYLLPTSAGDYVASKGKELSDYTLKFVQGYAEIESGVLSSRELLEEAILCAEKIIIEKGKILGAEIVVDAKPNSSRLSYDIMFGTAFIMGTALIPNKKGDIPAEGFSRG